MERVDTWLGTGHGMRAGITRPAPAAAGQRGNILLLFAPMVVVLIGFLGFALDLAMVYNRRAELQNVTASTALAAARQLNGTTAGVTAALQRAQTAAAALKYGYNQFAVTWSNAAISFSTSANGPWLDAANAQATPNGLLFAKVDTSALDANLGTVNLAFMKALSSAFASTSTAATAIAGRSSILVTPLAICAMNNAPAAPRPNPGAPQTELVEFGFRRGVSYDLMQLNPNGAAAQNFVVDPLDPPGVPGAAANTFAATVSPFVCTGTLAIPRVRGGTITVASPFPLATLFNQLNSRFDQYVNNLCSPNGAPPDRNIRSYTYTAIPWMTTAPGQQSALTIPPGANLLTVADPLPAPADNTAPKYGPLWAYARAVPYAAFQASPTEPASGYTGYAPASWATLYNPGQPAANSNYPGSTPYRLVVGANFLAPSALHLPGVANRRVLNVPLLSCPVGGGAVTTATVLGIGRFFMTVPATATSIFAEFAGAVPEQSLGGPVELVQ